MMRTSDLIIFCLVLKLFIQSISWAETCCEPKEIKPINNLTEILDKHEKWLASGGREGKQANLSYKNLSGKADFERRNLSEVNFTGALLHKASFEGSTLRGANFTCAQLQYANFRKAKLFKAKLNCSDLGNTFFDDSSDLFEAELNGADLYKTEFDGANLGKASFRGAFFRETNLKSINFRKVDLENALYQPANIPDSGRLSGIKGLKTVRIDISDPDFSGLVQLRNALINAGLRDLERDATYAIEAERTKNLWHKFKKDKLKNLLCGFQTVLRILAFDIPTQYGRSPSRPLLIIFVFGSVLSIVYIAILCQKPFSEYKSGIFYIIPENTIEYSGNLEKDTPVYTISEKSSISRLVPNRFYKAILWGIYFSILSAFRVGFREINIGNWISRIQPTNFELVATGWLRTLAGFQSLVSVYMVAICLLTYFGRPFQ